MKTEWEKMRSIDCDDSFAVLSSGTISPELVARKTRNMTSESRLSSKKISSVRKSFVFVVDLLAATILPLTSTFSSKGLSMCVLEQSGYGLLEKI